MGCSKAHRRGGRPCRLTVDVALDLVHLVSQGETLEDAARLAGLGPTTLWRWRAAGRAGDPRFSALVEAIDRARRGSGLARLVRRNRRDPGRRLPRNRGPGSGGRIPGETVNKQEAIIPKPVGELWQAAGDDPRGPRPRSAWE